LKVPAILGKGDEMGNLSEERMGSLNNKGRTKI
jgi:hypothetical protein